MKKVRVAINGFGCCLVLCGMAHPFPDLGKSCFVDGPAHLFGYAWLGTGHLYEIVSQTIANHITSCIKMHFNSKYVIIFCFVKENNQKL